MHHRTTKKKKSEEIRKNNINNVIIATLNINSLVSKFDDLKVIGQEIFDISIINETKSYVPFAVAEFCVNGPSAPYRLG